MQECECELDNEDLQAALKEMHQYVDVTEEDLKKIYAIALRHARERLVYKIPVKDVMTTNVISIKKNTDCHEASKLLSENKISGLPVIDDENHVIGIVTEADILYMTGIDKDHTFKDILRHIISGPSQKRRYGDTVYGDTVEDIMTSPAIVTKSDVDIRKIATILDEKRIKRLPVVDDDNKLIGIISRANIVRFIGKQ